jgi:hypothetical protein
MPSPFPGMDPYLEDPAFWPGIHDSLIIYARDVLQPLLRPRYYIEVRERIYFEDMREVIYPDATIHRRRPPLDTDRDVAVLPADEPTILRVETRQRETFLEICALGSHEVVTVIEVISPSNKHVGGHGRTEYRKKQDEVLSSTAHLVEIDLLRGGAHVVVAPAGELRTLPSYDYVSCVSRATARQHVEVYAVSVRQRLPRIRIPLREPDPDVVLDLPSIFARCYDNGDYRTRVDYTASATPPLRPNDEAWADALLCEAGLRGPGPGK